MPCYSPINGYICQDRKFRLSPKGDSRAQTVPCGQCVGCRLERSRQWAVRCAHEASLYERNCFITLTYSDEFLPSDRGLRYPDFQKFMKRLRRFNMGHQPRADGSRPIRFYMCGEYGENFDRPHYHACIFNFDFQDKKLWKKTDSGSMIYRSALLEELWPFGFSSIGDVNFQSAAYVARYIMKKITGDAAKRHYFNRETGEVISPEFNKMSLKPGIGADWFGEFQDDVFKFDADGNCVSDSVVLKGGRKVKPPKYYDKLLKRGDVVSYIRFDGEVVTFSPKFSAVQMKRSDDAEKNVDDNTTERLKVKEQVQLAQLSRLKRKL